MSDGSIGGRHEQTRSKKTNMSLKRTVSRSAWYGTWFWKIWGANYRGNLSIRKWAKAPACLFVLKFKKMRPDVPCAFLKFKKMGLDVPP